MGLTFFTVNHCVIKKTKAPWEVILQLVPKNQFWNNKNSPRRLRRMAGFYLGHWDVVYFGSFKVIVIWPLYFFHEIFCKPYSSQQGPFSYFSSATVNYLMIILIVAWNWHNFWGAPMLCELFVRMWYCKRPVWNTNRLGHWVLPYTRLSMCIQFIANWKLFDHGHF